MQNAAILLCKQDGNAVTSLKAGFYQIGCSFYCVYLLNDSIFNNFPKESGLLESGSSNELSFQVFKVVNGLQIFPVRPSGI